MTQPQQFEFDDIHIDVVRKKIKNIYLRVHPPDGHVRISAPMRMSLALIRAFATSRLGWIREQRTRIRAHTHTQRAETRAEYLRPEHQYAWGERYALCVIEHDGTSSVEVHDGTMTLRVRPTTTDAVRQTLVNRWYQRQLERAIPPLIAKWEPRMGVKAGRVSIRKMKTRWGSCSPASGNIRLNLELAKKPPECLEYVVVHELVHLLEPSHNRRFFALMDKFWGEWRTWRQVLNRRQVDGGA